jgi:hypothetical protein
LKLGKKGITSPSNFVDLHDLANLTAAGHAVAQLVLLHASLAGNVVLAGQENTVLLVDSAEPAFVRFLLLGLAARLAQLALEGQTAS